MKDRAVEERNEAEAGIKEAKKETDEKLWTQKFGQAVLDIRRANIRLRWASSECMEIIQRSEDPKLFEDVTINARPPEPGDKAKDDEGEDEETE
jgi:hypothetical protein